MLKQNQIFIHIPKTGGTTLNFLLFGEDSPVNPNFNYRHIVYETKMSNSGDIFNPLKNDKYLNNQIIMMLRHPVDRIISEYYFLRERSEFFNLLKPVPKSFKDYVKNKQTHNYNVSFLLGKKIYSNDYMNITDLKLIINSIEKLEIKIGINEYFEDSLNYFAQELNLNLPKTVQSKRITIKRPNASEIGEDLKNEILKNNQLDLKLYNYALKKFNERKVIKNNKIKITGDKYDYAKTYTNRFSLFEVSLKNKDFIKNNSLFFKQLSSELNKKSNLSSKDFVDSYIKSTIKALKDRFPKISFQELDLKLENIAPLEKLDLLSKFIDNNKEFSKKVLTFNISCLITPKSMSFFSNFLKKF